MRLAVVVMGLVMTTGLASAEPALPARSADKARLALPAGECAFVIVEVGAIAGERHECDRDAAVLEGFEPLAATALDEVAPGLTLVQKKRVLEARYDGKRVGKVKLAAGVVASRAVLVRGARPYVYAEVAGAWVAIAIKGGASDWKVADPLIDQLRRAAPAGKEIAILPSPDGLTAVSADGSWRQVLVAGLVDIAGVDPRAGVVWFTREHWKSKKKWWRSLQVLDLLGDGQPRTVIARFGGPELVIHYADRTRFSVNDASWEGRVDLYLGARSRATEVDVRFDHGCSGGDDGKPTRIAVKGKRFLAELARRVEATDPPPEVTPPPEWKVDQVFAIPRTRLQLVVVSEGDCGEPEMALRDPDKREFIDFEDPAKRAATWPDHSDDLWLATARRGWFSPSGEAWIHEGTIRRRDGGKVALAEYVVLDENKQPAESGAVHRVFPDGTLGRASLDQGGGWLDVGVHVDLVAD
jgi:hypothetical protein